MLCSKCKKCPATIFINEPSKEDKNRLVGYCNNCAKQKGISVENTSSDDAPNNSNNIHNMNLDQMASQFGVFFKDLSNTINTDNVNSEIFSDEGSVPIGSIFGAMFNPIMNTENTDNQSSHSNDNKRVKVEKKPKEKKRRVLDVYGTNLTVKAKNNQIDTVIGRDKEINRVIQILNRRTKNNPCLIGEPGVGKTAIAQGLAIKIASGKVPAKLMNKDVYLLDMTSVVAGTQFRGQFEGRMKAIIDECKSLGNIILVIDEIHNIIGAGDSENSMSAANILKPSLANGEIQLIGTTTLREYRKYIEKDSALERRFQSVLVEEPNVNDSSQILEGIKKYYEDYHKVKISNDIIKKTVIMSEKYIHDRFLPDKAIDILDEACSRKNLDNIDLYKLEVLKNELAVIQAQKEEAAQADSTEDYQKAATLKAQECKLIEDIDKLNKRIKFPNITEQDIAQVIENWTKIPVKKITEAETDKLLNLESNLHKKIIGQNKAVEAVSRAIRRNRSGLKSTKRPPSFIFVGPTGVGKTQLAKTLAYELFGSEDSIIRVDMSEYMEKHSTSKLIGSPPGYVGYDDAGQLTEKVKRKPYSIILLDEIEKAHPDVFNLLLQILDDGKLTDSQGNAINFENTIIIMTSNSGSDLNTNSIGFGNTSSTDSNKILDSLKETFRPEFLNRVDETVIFDTLNRNELLQIIDLMLEDTKKTLSDKNISMNVTKNAKLLLLEKGTDLKYGARPLRRAIQKYIEDELSEMILRKHLENGQNIEITCNKEKFEFIVK